MAVEDKYVQTEIVAGKLAKAVQAGGAQVTSAIVTFEVAAADDNGSVFRVLRNLGPDVIIKDIKVGNDAITGGTDYEIGLYEQGVAGTVIDLDIFLGTTTMASARASGSEISGVSAVNVADRVKSIHELAGHNASTKLAGYDLAVTANVVGTVAGTITLIIDMVQG